MTGDSLTAAEAARIGLINHAVPAAELDQRVDDFTRRLVAGPRQAIRWTKTAVNIGLKQLAHGIMDVGLSYELITNSSADHQEAVSAFRDKRRPVFTGR